MQSLMLSFYMASEEEVKEFFDSQIKCKYQGRVEGEYRSQIPDGECFGRYNYFVKNDNGYVFPGCSYLSEECVGDGPCGNSNLTEIYWPEPKVGDYIYGIMNDSGDILRVGKANFDANVDIPNCETYSEIPNIYSSGESESREYFIFYIFFLFLIITVFIFVLILVVSKKFKLLEKISKILKN